MKRPVIHNAAATTVPSSWSGMAILISRFTPDKDVYVEAPVKFISMKLVSAGINSIHAIVLGLLPRFPDRYAMNATAKPMQSPFIANAFPGNHGNSMGPSMTLARKAENTSITHGMPTDRAVEVE